MSHQGDVSSGDNYYNIKMYSFGKHPVLTRTKCRPRTENIRPGATQNSCRIRATSRQATITITSKCTHLEDISLDTQQMVQLQYLICTRRCKLCMLEHFKKKAS
eukprot:scaffold8690_cov190-Amphora_coffeaeformis.AAC.3